MTSTTHHVYTKSRLIRELAFRAGIKQAASRQILDVLAEIIKRETPNGPFVLPGLFKFEVVPRKARRIRNPRTGEALIIPPQKTLKVTISRAAKLAIAPRLPAVPAATYVPPTEEPVATTEQVPAPTEPTVATASPAPAPAEPVAAEPAPAPTETPAATEQTTASAEPPTPAETPATAESAPAAAETTAAAESAPASAEPVAAEPAPASTEPSAAAEQTTAPAETPAATEPEPAPAEQQTISDGEPSPSAISFRCPGCEQEIEAPANAIGLEAECPMCGRIVVVPAKSEPGTMYDTASGDDQKAADRVVSSKDAEEIDPSVLKNLTIRIDADALGLDFSADADKKATPVDEELVSFFCPNCHQEIEASIDLAGTQAECPNCATTFEIPFESETAPQAVERHAPGDDSQAQIQARKSKTMRIDLPDNF